MITLEQLVYQVYSDLAGGTRISDDINTSIELLEFSVVNNRAMLIRQDQSKGRSLSDNIIQTLPCVKVETIDVSLCPCHVTADCTIKRSTIPLPRFIEVHQKDLITKVSGVNLKSKSWSIIPYARAVNSGIHKNTKDTVKVFLYNRYLYIINAPTALQYASVTGVFEDPRDLYSFSTCSGTPCYDSTQSFPISAHMVPVLKELVIKDLGLQRQIPADNTGNERDDKIPVKQ